MTCHPRIELSAPSIMMDGEVSIRLIGFMPETEVTLSAELEDDLDTEWRSSAAFLTDWIGTVDLDRDAPVRGSYDGVDPDGLLWSLAPVPPEENLSFKMQAGEAGCRLHALGLPHYEDERPDRVRFTAEVGGRKVATATFERHRFPPGVQRTVVHEGRLRGVLNHPHGFDSPPGVVLISGSGGGISGSAAALLAAHGYAVFDLAYFNYTDLPDHLEEIPLEYFKEGIEWMRNNLGHERIAILGGSRGGEGVLAVASAFPDLPAAVAAVIPGDLYVLGRFDGVSVKPSWTLNGEPLPPDERLEELANLQSYDAALLSSTEMVNTKEVFFDPWYFNPEVYERSAIPIEKMRCPVLFVSAGDDQCWDSPAYAERAVERLQKSGFKYPFLHVRCEHSGHYLVAPGMPTTMCDSGYHSVLKLPFTMGGTPAATAQGQRKFWQEVLRFYEATLCPPVPSNRT